MRGQQKVLGTVGKSGCLVNLGYGDSTARLSPLWRSTLQVNATRLLSELHSLSSIHDTIKYSERYLQLSVRM